MNSDGTVCYTNEENRDIDWREIKGKIEWFSLLDPKTSIKPPCYHEEDECPAKNIFISSSCERTTKNILIEKK